MYISQLMRKYVLMLMTSMTAKDIRQFNEGFPIKNRFKEKKNFFVKKIAGTALVLPAQWLFSLNKY